MRFRHGLADRAGVAFVLGVVLLSSGVAAAVDPEELIRQGVALRRSGDDAAALQRFEEAFQLGASKKALAQIGMAEQALGRWVAAHEHLTRALEDTNDAWIKKNRLSIGDALNRVSEHVGQLVILGGSPGADVRLDGAGRGKLPVARPFVLATGAVTIDLVAPGFVSRQRITTVRAREVVRESFEPLEPLATRDASPTPAKGVPMAANSGPATDATRGSATGPTPTGDGAGSATPEQPQGDQASPAAPSLRPAAKWAAWGVGALSLGVGIFGAVRQDSAGKDFSNGCALDAADHVVVQTGSTRTMTECQSLKDKTDSNFTLEVVGLIGAGVFAAAGVVLWLTEPAPAETQTTSLFCSPAIAAGGGPSIGCTLRF